MTYGVDFSWSFAATASYPVIMIATIIVAVVIVYLGKSK